MYDNMIFICGCGHSGTTILNKIMSNHKNIYGLDYETGIFVKHKGEKLHSEINKLNKQRKLCNKKWLCEKTPGHVYHIDTIFQLVRTPKIILLVRDGRDVVSSLHKRYSNFEFSISRWIKDNQQWLNSEHRNKLYVLRYEDFVKSPEKEIKKICYYLEEDYDDRMLDYPKQEMILPKNIFDKEISGEYHKLLRLYQINQNIYDGTKRYLKDLTALQMNLLYSNEEFMELMQKFNYFD
jgi:hypothetical protein